MMRVVVESLNLDFKAPTFDVLGTLNNTLTAMGLARVAVPGFYPAGYLREWTAKGAGFTFTCEPVPQPPIDWRWWWESTKIPGRW